MAEGQVRGLPAGRRGTPPLIRPAGRFQSLSPRERMAEDQVRGCPRGQEARPSSALRAPSPRGEKECLVRLGAARGAKSKAPHPPCGSFEFLSPRGEDGRRPGEGSAGGAKSTPPSSALRAFSIPLSPGERMAEGQVRGCPRGEETRPSSALRAPSPRGEKECLVRLGAARGAKSKAPHPPCGSFALVFDSSSPDFDVSPFRDGPGFLTLLEFWCHVIRRFSA